MPPKEQRFAGEALEPPIFAIRGHRVILDADLARLYSVTTKRLNEATKRNRQRFPDDFAFQLTTGEFNGLRSQYGTAGAQPTDSPNKNMSWSQFATSSSRYRGAVYRPWAFTEHGALMAANILRSERAVQMSIFVIRAFVRLRERIAANEAILKRLAEIDKTLLQHDASLRDIYRKLLPLLQPPSEPPKRRIGFVTGDGVSLSDRRTELARNSHKTLYADTRTIRKCRKPVKPRPALLWRLSGSALSFSLVPEH